MGQLGAGWVRAAIYAHGAFCPSGGSQDSVGSGRGTHSTSQEEDSILKNVPKTLRAYGTGERLICIFLTMSCLLLGSGYGRPHRMNWEVSPFQFSGSVYAELVLLLLQCVAGFTSEAIRAQVFSWGRDSRHLVNSSSFFYCQA